VKINVDAAFKAEIQQGATGVVIRDENGHVLAAKCKWYDSIPNILTDEAYAARDGAVLMNLLNRPKVMLETDSLELQSLWRSKDNNRSTILPVLNEVQELMGRCMVFEFSHVKREANSVAHGLAKYASISCLENTWLYENPECILPSIQHDCNGDV
jgi:hypothetical protein